MAKEADTAIRWLVNVPRMQLTVIEEVFVRRKQC